MSRTELYYDLVRSQVNGRHFRVLIAPRWGPWEDEQRQVDPFLALLDIAMPRRSSIGWEVNVRRRLSWPFYDAFRLAQWRFVPDAELPTYQTREELHRTLLAAIQNQPPETWRMSARAIRLAKRQASVLRTQRAQRPAGDR